MSSRIEDLRDLSRMLDAGEISQQEYEIVKADLLDAPAEEWLAQAVTSDPAPAMEGVDGDASDAGGSQLTRWLAVVREVPSTYRAALFGAVLVLVVGGFIASRSDATSTIATAPRSEATIPTTPPEESLGIALDGLADGWNAVEHPPRISGGLTTSPEPGPLDSFLYRFNDSALLAGAYQPSNGYVSALMVSSSLHYEAVPNLYVHLCYLLHPGSQACLETFVEEAGLFGKSPADQLGTEQVAGWDFEGRSWRFETADDIVTIRIQADDPAD